MYILKDNLDIKMNKTIASEIIGLSRPTLTNIMNRKIACRKVVAYCITKYINENSEIEDYFDRVGDGNER